MVSWACSAAHLSDKVKLCGHQTHAYMHVDKPHKGLRGIFCWIDAVCGMVRVEMLAPRCAQQTRFCVSKTHRRLRRNYHMAIGTTKPPLSIITAAAAATTSLLQF